MSESEKLKAAGWVEEEGIYYNERFKNKGRLLAFTFAQVLKIEGLQ